MGCRLRSRYTGPRSVCEVHINFPLESCACKVAWRESVVGNTKTGKKEVRREEIKRIHGGGGSGAITGPQAGARRSRSAPCDGEDVHALREELACVE